MPAGVYRIRNITNGRCYIGETEDLALRWQYHLIRLRVRTHKSKTLQRDFNRWILDCYAQPTQMPFVFEVLVECGVDQLHSFERMVIAALQPYYNTQKFKEYRKVMNPKVVKQLKERFKWK